MHPALDQDCDAEGKNYSAAEPGTLPLHSLYPLPTARLGKLDNVQRRAMDVIKLGWDMGIEFYTKGK